MKSDREPRMDLLAEARERLKVRASVAGVVNRPRIKADD